MATDYYKILGVNKSANQDEIKKAFRTLAHEHHPDKKTGNIDKFKEINEAYQVLGNEEKRQQYDQYGQTFSGAGSNGGGGRPGGNPFGQGFGGFSQGGVNFDFGDGGDLGDIFGSFFGGGRSQSTRGRDLQAELTIDFKESVFGVEKEVELNKQISCDVCNGSGAEPGSKINTCSTCGGSGRVVRMQQTILGNFQTQAVCSDCRGSGKKPDKKCNKCHGAGHIRGNEKINVIIPAGISDGQTVKIANKGDLNDHGQAGDLYILIRVTKNKNFIREGDDILSEVHINLKQALLGDKIEVETVDGAVSLKIPEGTQSHTQFRLKDKGVTHLRQHGRGDQLVEVIVDIPKKISRDQRKLIERMDF